MNEKEHLKSILAIVLIYEHSLSLQAYLKVSVGYRYAAVLLLLFRSQQRKNQKHYSMQNVQY